MKKLISLSLYLIQVIFVTAASTASAFSSGSLKSVQSATPPPSYNTTVSNTPAAVPESSQRPSIVVPVPPVQSIPKVDTAQEIAPTGGTVLNNIV